MLVTVTKWKARQDGKCKALESFPLTVAAEGLKRAQHALQPAQEGLKDGTHTSPVKLS